MELGALLEAGLDCKLFKLIVRSMLDVNKLPEHLRADTARVLAVLG